MLVNKKKAKPESELDPLNICKSRFKTGMEVSNRKCLDSNDSDYWNFIDKDWHLVKVTEDNCQNIDHKHGYHVGDIAFSHGQSLVITVYRKGIYAKIRQDDIS